MLTHRIAKATNPKCAVQATLVNDRSPPTMTVDLRTLPRYTPYPHVIQYTCLAVDGRRLQFNTQHLSETQILNYLRHLAPPPKEEDKKYYRHTGYPGGIKDRTVREQREMDSTALIEKAVYGMVPVNKLRNDRMKRLKVYTGSEHNHAAQQPVAISFKKEGK